MSLSILALIKWIVNKITLAAIALIAVLGAYYTGRLAGKKTARQDAKLEDYANAEKIRDDLLRALHDGNRMHKHKQSGWRD